VETVLKPGDGTPVPLTYVLRQAKDGPPGKWLIIDVLLNGGISELAVRASEYNRVLNDGGVTALISALDKQAKAMLAH
jgi:phospholipid transport system substrate-binding protein